MTRGKQQPSRLLSASHAARTAEGQRLAAAWIERLRARRAQPDELARVVSALYGPVLRGFCAEIEAAVATAAPDA